MSATFHLAQINVGRITAPLDAPELKAFVDNLNRINALAERSAGFVWRSDRRGRRRHRRPGLR